MKMVAATAALLLGAAGVASAQDGRKMDELQREFERSMKALQQKFDEERSRLEKEFRAARERLMPPQRPTPKGEPPPFERKLDTQELLQRVLERLERLERKLDQDMPRFDFKRFERELEPFREFAPRWREFVPKFKDEDFRFEFRKKRDGEEKEEKKVEKRKLEKKQDKGGEKNY
jgi:hypothetical protein